MDAAIERLFSESNVDRSEWDKVARVIEEACTANGVRPVDFDGFSVAELYKQPDARPPSLRDTWVLAILRGKALVLMREVGPFRKRVEAKSIEFDQYPDLQFWPEDNDTGNRWGFAELQAVTSGSTPLFRLAWGWSGSSLSSALHERDRVHGLLRDAASSDLEEIPSSPPTRSSQAFLIMHDGRALPLAASVDEAESILNSARATGQEMVSFPSPAYEGAINSQLTETVERIVGSEDVG